MSAIAMIRILRALVLTLFFAAAVFAAPTLHLVGDSTMADKPTEPTNPKTGWGQALPTLLKSEAVRVVNHAMNGRSTKSFIDEGRWAAVVAASEASMRPAA